LTNEDIARIAAFLNESEFRFIQSYTRLRPHRDGLALKDQPNGSCVFLNGQSCAVHPVKPAQCAGFPNEWRFPGWRNVCAAIEAKDDHAGEGSAETSVSSATSGEAWPEGYRPSHR
jgi:uncharacterized protein